MLVRVHGKNLQKSLVPRSRARPERKQYSVLPCCRHWAEWGNVLATAAEGGRKGEKCCKSCWGTQERRQRLWSLIRVSASSSSSGKLQAPTVSSTHVFKNKQKKEFPPTQIYMIICSLSATQDRLFSADGSITKSVTASRTLYGLVIQTHTHTNIHAHTGAHSLKPPCKSQRKQTRWFGRSGRQRLFGDAECWWEIHLWRQTVSGKRDLANHGPKQQPK